MAKRQPRTIFISKGVELLVLWLAAQRKLDDGVSQNELAITCGSTSGTLSKVVSGLLSPNLPLALALQTECEIPVPAWAQPARAKFVRALRASAQKKAA